MSLGSRLSREYVPDVLHLPWTIRQVRVCSHGNGRSPSVQERPAPSSRHTCQLPVGQSESSHRAQKLSLGEHISPTEGWRREGVLLSNNLPQDHNRAEKFLWPRVFLLLFCVAICLGAQILTTVSHTPAVFSRGLQPRSSRLPPKPRCAVGCAIWACVSALHDDHTRTNLPTDISRIPVKQQRRAVVQKW